MPRILVWALLPVLAACNPASAPASRDGAVADQALSDGAAGDLDDTGADLAEAPQPDPPSGYARCGSGAITQADAEAACTEIGASPKDCTAVTVSGGSWQVWCSPAFDALYVWAQILGVHQAAATACAGSVPQFVGAYVSIGAGISSGGQTHQSPGIPPPSDSLWYDYQTTLTAPMPTGTATIGLSAMLAGGTQCFDEAPPGGEIVSGFHVTWTAR